MTQAGERVKRQVRTFSFFPAWLFTAVYVVLLLYIPTRLIVGPIGAPGAPASLAAIAGLLWWCCAVLGGLNNRRGLSPMRIALALLTICTLAS